VGLELLHGLVGVVDESEAGGLATTVLGAETEDGDLVLVGLVELGELLAELILGDVGTVGVEDITASKGKKALVSTGGSQYRGDQQCDAGCLCLRAVGDLLVVCLCLLPLRNEKSWIAEKIFSWTESSFTHGGANVESRTDAMMNPPLSSRFAKGAGLDIPERSATAAKHRCSSWGEVGGVQGAKE